MNSFPTWSPGLRPASLASPPGFVDCTKTPGLEGGPRQTEQPRPCCPGMLKGNTFLLFLTKSCCFVGIFVLDDDPGGHGRGRVAVVDLVLLVLGLKLGFRLLGRRRRGWGIDC